MAAHSSSDAPPIPGSAAPDDAERLSTSSWEESSPQSDTPPDAEVAASAEVVTSSNRDPIVDMLKRGRDPKPYGSSSTKPIDPLPTNAKSGDEDDQDAANTQGDTASSSDGADKKDDLSEGEGVIERRRNPFSGGADPRWRKETISVVPYNGGTIGVIGQRASGPGTQHNACVVIGNETFSYSLETGGIEADRFFAAKTRQSAGNTGTADQSSDRRTADASSDVSSSNSGTDSTQDTQQEPVKETRLRQTIRGNTAGDNRTKTNFRGTGYRIDTPPREETTNNPTATGTQTVRDNEATGKSTQSNYIGPAPGGGRFVTATVRGNGASVHGKQTNFIGPAGRTNFTGAGRRLGNHTDIATDDTQKTESRSTQDESGGTTDAYGNYCAKGATQSNRVFSGGHLPDTWD